MMRKFWVLVATMTMATSALADIYKCTDDAGHVTYSNVQSKGCVRLISSGSSEPAASIGKSGKGAASNPTPANFPRVDGTTQRARDDDRRRILDSEVAAEQKALEDARKALAEQESIRSGDEKNYQRVLDRLQPYKDKVALHERNLEALKKEIGNLR